MINSVLKTIITEYNGAQVPLDIDPSEPIETFIYHVRSIHKIPNESLLTLYNPDTKRFIVPTTTSMLWTLQENDIPIYYVNGPGKNKKCFLKF